MAFCNSCGASIAPGTRFCNQCGKAILTSSPTTVASPPVGGSAPPAAPTPAPTSGGGALKVILIVVGVIVLVGILGVTSIAFVAWHIAHRTHIHQEGDNVKVETPFGSVQATKDPQEAARNLGVDAYPGAQILQQGAVSANLGSIHTVALNFETSDSVDNVCSFYKAKFPTAMVRSTEANQCSIVSNDQKNMITINAKTQNGKTRIVITNVSKSGAANPSPN
ncbi:MAG: zinc ribbon domain-containing protein [Candidatus Sulfotelmatobacter sp.]